jgi:hypothetical protein
VTATTTRSLPNHSDRRALPWSALPAVLAGRLQGAVCLTVGDWGQRGRSIFGVPPKLATLVDAAIEAMHSRGRT